MHSLVLSHLHYSSILINGISQNLRSTLEKQLSWAVKACFHKKKYDSSRDLKLQYKNLPVGLFLDLKAVLYFWKYQNGLLPAFKHQEITTAKLKVLKRSILLVCNSMTNSSYWTKSFFKIIGNNYPPCGTTFLLN